VAGVVAAAPAAAGGGSGGVGVPAGFFGSKNPLGFDMLDTNTMCFAAVPASLMPGLSPTRGSVVLGVAGRSCA
jgi:hypothetical protein